MCPYVRSKCSASCISNVRVPQSVALRILATAKHEKMCEFCAASWFCLALQLISQPDLPKGKASGMFPSVPCTFLLGGAQPLNCTPRSALRSEGSRTRKTSREAPARATSSGASGSIGVPGFHCEKVGERGGEGGGNVNRRSGWLKLVSAADVRGWEGGLFQGNALQQRHGEC